MTVSWKLFGQVRYGHCASYNHMHVKGVLPRPARMRSGNLATITQLLNRPPPREGPQTWLGPQPEGSGALELWEYRYSNSAPFRLCARIHRLTAKGPLDP